MVTDSLKRQRAKKIRKLLTRWKKRQRSKQKELPFERPEDIFQHHSAAHSKKIC